MDPKWRAFVAFLSAALATRSISTNAQQATRLRTVGVLMGLANDAKSQARVKVIEQGLAKKGWIVGQNLHMEYRYAASDIDRMLSLSKELVALQPDVIIGHSTPVVAALLKVTQSSSDSVRGRGRPGWQRLRSEPSAAGWKRHRLQQSRADYYRKIFINTKRPETAAHPRRPHAQSRVFPAAEHFLCWHLWNPRRSFMSPRSQLKFTAAPKSKRLWLTLEPRLVVHSLCWPITSHRFTVN